MAQEIVFNTALVGFPDDGPPCLACGHRLGAHCRVCKACHSTKGCRCEHYIVVEGRAS